MSAIISVCFRGLLVFTRCHGNKVLRFCCQEIVSMHLTLPVVFNKLHWLFGIFNFEIISTQFNIEGWPVKKWLKRFDYDRFTLKFWVVEFLSGGGGGGHSRQYSNVISSLRFKMFTAWVITLVSPVYNRREESIWLCNYFNIDFSMILYVLTFHLEQFKKEVCLSMWLNLWYFVPQYLLILMVRIINRWRDGNWLKTY